MALVKFDRLSPFNDIPLLPPTADIENNPVILKKLVTASRALGNVNGNIRRLPNPFMLVNTIALQEARTSTEIENIFTTEDELYKAISDSHKEREVDPATKEVLKYREALWAGYDELNKEPLISEDLIMRLFSHIKESQAAYRSPQSKVVIKRGNSEFRAGETIYTPPRDSAVIKKLMTNLVDFLNDDNSYPLDPLLKMCIAHYQFEAVHPFHEGNGRVGRILNLLYLVSKNLLTIPVLYTSKFIIRNKEEYYYKLGAVTQRGDWEAWILFMLDTIEKTAILTNDLINEIVEQMDATFNHVGGQIKWYSKEVNEAIFSQPYIKPQVIGRILDKGSRTTLTKYFDELVEHQVLSPKKDGVEVFYLNDDLLRILEG